MGVSLKKCRGSFISKLFPGSHVEQSRSGALADYVRKESTRVDDSYFELGRPPMSGKSGGHEWDEIWRAGVEGRLLDIPASVRVQSYHVLKSIRKDNLKPMEVQKTCHAFVGPTGTGKSRRAWLEATFDAYPKNPNTKFWDGYAGHKHVVIDEFRGRIDISYLLTWLDRYPVIVEAKHGACCLEATTVWITSNLHPKDWYPDMDAATLDALLRRLNVVVFHSVL